MTTTPPLAGLALRLRPTVEALHDGGAVWFTRDGVTAELELDSGDGRASALVRLLEAGAPARAALLDGMRAAGHPMTAAELEAALELLAAHGLLDDDPATARRQLSDEDRERYDRQLAYLGALRPGEAAARQRRLLASTVVIVGVGGLGSWAASALACAGVGRLVLFDDDRVERSNLNRQVLFRAADVGRRKVELAAAALVALRPDLDVDARPERVASAAAARAAVAGADLVIDTADWPPYELERWIDRACVELGVPHMCAAQYPPWVRIGPTYVPGRTGCVACQERAARRAYPGYDALLESRAARAHVAAATLGPASGVVGSLLAMEALHLLTGVAEPATLGAGVVIDLRDLTTTREAVPRDPDCACAAAAG